MGSVMELLKIHLVLDSELAPENTKNWPGAARVLFHNLIVYNPLFMLSALLIFVGAWLLNSPQVAETRSLQLLFQLLGTIVVYQFCLLVAGYVLSRRASMDVLKSEESFDKRAYNPGLERDLRNLLVVLCPFLLDITFTNASLEIKLVNSMGLIYALGLAVFTVVLATVAAVVAARLTERRFDRLSWTALLAGPVLVAFFPIIGALMSASNLQGEIGVVVGFTLACLIFLYSCVTGDNQDRWVVRRLAPLTIVAALIHGCGTTWSYEAPGTESLWNVLSVLAPVLMLLGPVLPKMLWPSFEARDYMTPVVLPWGGVALLAYPDLPIFGMSGLDFALGALVVIHGSLVLRRRSFVSFLNVLVGVYFLSSGSPLSPVTEIAFPLALFVFGMIKRIHPLALAAFLGFAAFQTGESECLGEAGGAIFSLGMLGGGLLAWTHIVHGTEPEGAAYRFAGCFLIFVPPSLVALGSADPATQALSQSWAWASILSLFVLARVTRLRGYAYPSLLLVFETLIYLAPRSAAGWGGVGLGCGFVAIVLGVTISFHRDALLLRFTKAEEETLGESELVTIISIESDSGEDWLKRGAFVLGLSIAVALLVLPRMG
ncbi:MAG: hypothetical protein P1V97_26980 [Planctomycetota bacterium]|nr:hypothetical protein [Planctomycetota bacterium]